MTRALVIINLAALMGGSILAGIVFCSQKDQIAVLEQDLAALERRTDFLQVSVREGRAPEPSLMLSGTVTSDDPNQLVAELSSGNFLRQLDAGRKLLGLGAEAVPLLAQAVSEGEPKTRRAALLILGQTPKAESLPCLRDLLSKDCDSKTRAAILGILAKARDASAEDLFVAHLDHEDSLVRAVAANGVKRIGALTAVPRLAAGIADGQPNVQGEFAAALRHLAQIDASGVADALEEAVPAARFSAIRSLALDSSDAAELVVRRSLEDNDLRVRLAAARVLNAKGDEDAKRVVKAIAEGGDPALRKLARSILEVKGGGDGLTDTISK